MAPQDPLAWLKMHGMVVYLHLPDIHALVGGASGLRMVVGPRTPGFELAIARKVDIAIGKRKGSRTDVDVAERK